MPPFVTPHPFTAALPAAQGFEPGLAAFDWSALTARAAGADPWARHTTGAEVPRTVRPSAHLLQDMARELPALSPKLRRVAHYCMAHASTLHLCRIQDVAAASDTVPATVVRLAQRLGLHGFQELKLAFLDLVPATDLQDSRTAAQDAAAADASTAESITGPAIAQAALCDLQASMQALSTLSAQVEDPAFEAVVRALRTARQIRFDWAGEADRGIALQLQARLRALGCHQVGASKPGPTHRGEWLVQVAVCEDKASGGRALDTAPFGPRVLRLVRGRATPAAPAARRNSHNSHNSEATLIRCGNDARRMLTALAFCELLAAALTPPAPARPADPLTAPSLDHPTSDQEHP